MLQVTQQYLEAVYSPSREIVTRVFFNDHEQPFINEIIEVQVTETGFSSDILSIGEICTNKAEVKFFMPDIPIPLEGGMFKVEQGIMSEYETEEGTIEKGYIFVSLGVFYISEVQRTEGSAIVSIVGYDCTTRLDKDYTANIEFPSHIANVVNDICLQCHVNLSEYTFPDIEIDCFYEISCKEMLSYMASLMGKNVKANRAGNIEFYWWNDSHQTISKDIQYIDSFKKNTENDIVIHSLTSGSENNSLVSGDGYGISFENPYMTQIQLDNLYEELNGFTYTPCTVKYRGNPALEIGDMILVEDRNGDYHYAVISENQLIATGMNGTITAKGKTPEEIAISHSPTDKKLHKIYSSLQQAFKDTTETVIGAKGGYFVIDRDQNGFPSGFKIMDTPSLTDHTKGWIFNKSGFGFSLNGFKTLENIAIDMNGYINANAIHTGVISGTCFDIDLENGSIVMGKRGSEGTFESEWFRVDSQGISLSISNQTLEDIQDMNDRIDELGEEIEMNQNDLYKYLRWDATGLELGDKLSQVKMKLTNQKLSFLQNDNEVAYISNNKLYITEGLFMQKCTIGNESVGYYEWLMRTNGNMSLKYRGVKENGE